MRDVVHRGDTMRSVALVIGIDAYSFRPLTSAVADAESFKREIVDLGLVRDADVTLLTSRNGGASRDRIKEKIEWLYGSGDTFDRLLFYFSGHGLLKFSDGAQNHAQTALLAQDVRKIAGDGDKMIDFDEI